MTLNITWETPRPAREAEPHTLDNLMRECAIVCAALEGVPGNAQASLRLVDDESMRRLNRGARGLDVTTDVLSFPLISIPAGQGTLGTNLTLMKPEYDADTGNFELGDIVISLDRAREQAAAFGHGLARELAFLTAHAMLHLMGYDHSVELERAAMRLIERRVMRMLGLEV